MGVWKEPVPRWIECLYASSSVQILTWGAQLPRTTDTLHIEQVCKDSAGECAGCDGLAGRCDTCMKATTRLSSVTAITDISRGVILKNTPTSIYWAVVKYVKYCLACSMCSVNTSCYYGDTEQREIKWCRWKTRTLRGKIKLGPEKKVEDFKASPP